MYNPDWGSDTHWRISVRSINPKSTFSILLAGEKKKCIRCEKRDLSCPKSINLPLPVIGSITKVPLNIFSYINDAETFPVLFESYFWRALCDRDILQTILPWRNCTLSTYRVPPVDRIIFIQVESESVIMVISPGKSPTSSYSVRKQCWYWKNIDPLLHKSSLIIWMILVTGLLTT